MGNLVNPSSLGDTGGGGAGASDPIEVNRGVSFTPRKVETGEAYKIPEKSSTMMMGEMEVAGNLIVNGDLSVN
jgi:hypothetical protein